MQQEELYKEELVVEIEFNLQNTDKLVLD